jgi:hypothetical protein
VIVTDFGAEGTVGGFAAGPAGGVTFGVPLGTCGTLTLGAPGTLGVPPVLGALGIAGTATGGFGTEGVPGALGAAMFGVTCVSADQQCARAVVCSPGLPFDSCQRPGVVVVK